MSSTLIGRRTEFASSACIRRQRGSARGPIVFIDPGHGGLDTGATSIINGALVTEKTLTLAVARDLVPLLLRDGDRVVLSRTRDTAVVRLAPRYLDGSSFSALGERAEAEARVDCANAAHARVLLSIHFDSFAAPTVVGAETIYDSARPFSAANYRLAKLIQQSVVGAFAAAHYQVPNRGIQDDSIAGTPALTPEGAAYDHLLELGPTSPGWFNRSSDMPGALVEPLFISNDYEAGIAMSRQGQRVMARALAASMQRFLATEVNGIHSTTPTS